MTGKPENPEFARELSRDITFLQRSRRKFMGDRLKEYGISGTMYTVLLYVDRHPGATQDSIATQMYIDKCNVTRRVSRLEELGYIRRETDPTDRRQNNLYLTPEGEKLLPVIRGYLAQWGESTASGLSEQERESLLLLLSKMLGQL